MTFTFAGFASATATGISSRAAIRAEIRAIGMAATIATALSSRRRARHAEPRHMLQLARRQPSAILFAVQLAGLLIYPFMEGNDVRRALFSVFGIAVLGLVLL